MRSMMLLLIATTVLATESGSGVTCLSDPITAFAAGPYDQYVDPTQVCSASCRTGFADEMRSSLANGYLAVIGSPIPTNTYVESALECFCDTDPRAAQLTATGAMVWPDLAAQQLACANPNCRDNVMNSDYANSGSLVFTWFFLFPGMDVSPATFTRLKDMLTTCMCDAAGRGYHFYYGRDPSSDGSGALYCSTASCADLSDALIAAGAPIGSCRVEVRVLTTIGGFILFCIVCTVIACVIKCCILDKRNQRPPGASTAGVSMPVTTNAAVPMPMATATAVAVPMPMATATATAVPEV